MTPYLAAEIGPTVTSLDTALALVEVVAQAGFDAVKVQMLDAERLVGDPGLEVLWRNAEDGPERRAPMREVLARRHLAPADWAAVFEHAKESALEVIATVDFPSTLDLALKLGADAIKVCSGDLNHTAWIREVAGATRHVYLDTGAGALGEIERAVEAASVAPSVTLVHCPSGYPAPLPSIHLRMLSTLAALFPEVRLGFAGHNRGWSIEAAAVALGATYIEKTVCLSRETDLPEFMFSLEPGETADFVRAMSQVGVALGQARRPVDEQARRRKAPARRSAYAARDLDPAVALRPEDIDWRRPGGGIEPDMADLLWGRPLGRSVPAGQGLRWEDVL